MSDAINPDDVCTIPELARRLGVNNSTVQRWIERKRNTGFPDPFKVSGKMKLYDYSKVSTWFAAWKSTRKTYYA